MEKSHINRRIEQMRLEGTKFRTGVEIGQDIDAAKLRRRYDAVVIACLRHRLPRPAGPRP